MRPRADAVRPLPLRGDDWYNTALSARLRRRGLRAPSAGRVTRTANSTTNIYCIHLCRICPRLYKTTPLIGRHFRSDVDTSLSFCRCFFGKPASDVGTLCLSSLKPAKHTHTYLLVYLSCVLTMVHGHLSYGRFEDCCDTAVTRPALLVRANIYSENETKRHLAEFRESTRTSVSKYTTTL